MPTDSEIQDFARRHDIQLPAAYREFLVTAVVAEWLVDRRGQRIQFMPLLPTTGVHPLGLEVQIQLDKFKVPFCEVLKPHLEMWQGFTGQDYFESESSSEPFDAASIAAALCIGEDDNGDLLFLAPDHDYSVWHFHHDGCQVEKLADSFWEYLSSCKK